MKLSYDDQDVVRAADALYAEAQRESWGCPSSWGEPSWRAWYRKTVRLVLEAALAQQEEAALAASGTEPFQMVDLHAVDKWIAQRASESQDVAKAARTRVLEEMVKEIRSYRASGTEPTREQVLAITMRPGGAGELADNIMALFRAPAAFEDNIEPESVASVVFRAPSEAKPRFTQGERDALGAAGLTLLGTGQAERARQIQTMLRESQ